MDDRRQVKIRLPRDLYEHWRAAADRAYRTLQGELEFQLDRAREQQQTADKAAA